MGIKKTVNYAPGTAGSVWTLRTTVFGSYNTLIYVNNLYFAGGQSGTLTTSTDTIVWEQRTSGFDTARILHLYFF